MKLRHAIVLAPIALSTCAEMPPEISGLFGMGGTGSAPNSSSPSEHKLDIEATNPMLMTLSQNYISPVPNPEVRIQSKFRMNFRVRSATGQDLPFVSLGYRNYFVDGWTAISRGGVRCLLLRSDLQGTDIVSASWPRVDRNEERMIALRELAMQPPIHQVASPTQHVFASADFSCDRPLAAGDQLAIQITFWVQDRGRWVPDRFSFDKQTLEANPSECREFSRGDAIVGLACRQPDGSWRVVR